MPHHRPQNGRNPQWLARPLPLSRGRSPPGPLPLAAGGPEAAARRSPRGTGGRAAAGRRRRTSRSPPRDGREPPSPREPRRGRGRQAKPRVPPEEEVGRQVYVGNLNFNTDKKMMEDAVGEYGKIRDIYMPADNDGRPRGFCFVTFEEKTQAEACALGMNGRELDGRVVRCNIARPRPTPDDAAAAATTRPPARPPAADERIFVEGLPDDIKERELDDYGLGAAASTTSRSPRPAARLERICFRPARRGLRGARDGRHALRAGQAPRGPRALECGAPAARLVISRRGSWPNVGRRGCWGGGVAARAAATSAGVSATRFAT